MHEVQYIVEEDAPDNYCPRPAVTGAFIPLITEEAAELSTSHCPLLKYLPPSRRHELWNVLLPNLSMWTSDLLEDLCFFLVETTGFPVPVNFEINYKAATVMMSDLSPPCFHEIHVHAHAAQNTTEITHTHTHLPPPIFPQSGLEYICSVVGCGATGTNPFRLSQRVDAAAETCRQVLV